MNIKWTAKLLGDLHAAVSFLKASQMGEIFEHIYLDFIKKNEKYGLLREYSMEFLDAPEDPDIISKGEYRLAFMCQIVNTKKSTFYNPYRCLCHAINSFLSEYWSPNPSKSDNGVSYVTSLLAQLFPGARPDQLQQSFYVVKDLISIEKDIEWHRYGTLYNRCEMIDLSILPKGTGRNILQVLGTRRTFYLRLLLLTVHEVVHEHVIWSEIHKKMIFATYTGMTLVLDITPVVLALILSCRSYLNNT